MTFADPLVDYLYAVHRRMIEAARRNVPTLNGRVLDLGCGESPFRQFLPGDVTYVGVDRRAYSQVSLLASGEALPFADDVFDGVMCTEMICYSQRPWHVVAELARVLRPGGRLYLTAPFGWHALNDGDYFRFTPAGLRALVENGGFVVDAVEPIGGMWTSIEGELLEMIVADVWVPLTRRLGIKRGGYRAAALLAAPLNVAVSAAARLFDRVSPRNPLAVAVRARRGDGRRAATS